MAAASACEPDSADASTATKAVAANPRRGWPATALMAASAGDGLQADSTTAKVVAACPLLAKASPLLKLAAEACYLPPPSPATKKDNVGAAVQGLGRGV